MARLSTLVLLCVFVSGVARAESADAPLRQDDSTKVKTPPPSVTSRSEAGEVTRRVLMEVLFGGAGLVVGAVAGQALSGKGLGADCSSCAVDYNSGFVLGAGLGSGLGVYGTGSLMGGDGDFLATMLGAGLGTGAAFLFLNAAKDDLNGNAMVFTSLAMPLAGAIAGYEVSGALAGYTPSPPRWSSKSPKLIPVATTTKDGGVLGGLVGRF